MADYGRILSAGAEVLATGSPAGRILSLGAEVLVGPGPVATLEGAPGLPEWLLDLDLQGEILRFSVLPVVPLDNDDRAWPYREGLADLTVSLDGGRVSIAIEIAGLDVAQLVADGYDLASGRASLRWWREGTPLEAAILVASGRVVSPEYGGPFEPLVFSLEPGDPPPALVPPVAAAIGEATWPISDYLGNPFEPDEAVIGAAYPLVFGIPGREGGIVWDSLEYDIPATPAYIAEYLSGTTPYVDSKLLIAGHRVRAATVRITNVSPDTVARGSTVDNWDVEHVEDLLGRTVAVCSPYTPGATVTLTPGGEYWITWVDGGGLSNRAGSGELRGAGELIEYLLSASGLRVDVGRQRAASAVLDRFRLDGAILEPVDPRDWIEAHLGELLPLLRRESESGIWYELLRYDATAADATFALTAGEGLVRTSRVTQDASGIANAITLRYARNRGGEYAKRAAAQGRLAETSIARYGEIALELTTDIVYDDATAQALASSLLQWRALPRRAVAYEGGFELAALEPGAVVLLTDAELQIADQVAIVRSVTLSRLAVGVALELLQ